MTQDASFESLDRNDSAGPGPRACLLCGLETTLAPSISLLLQENGVGSHKLVFCTKVMLDDSLGAALRGASGDPPLPPEALPQVVVLSGMTGQQIHGIIDGWREAGLPTPVWASSTPSNLEFPLRTLLQELLAEQRAMARQKP